MSTIIDLVNIRELKRDDVHFILDSCINCLAQYTESLFKGWTYPDTRSYIELFTLAALRSPNYSTFICHLKDDENAIIGYLIGNPSINHIFFQYTKYTYRKLGIQKNLLLPLLIDEKEPISVNWQTKEMLKLQKANKITIKNRFVEELFE